jgi:hypothetical protein
MWVRRAPMPLVEEAVPGLPDRSIRQLLVSHLPPAGWTLFAREDHANAANAEFFAGCCKAEITDALRVALKA